MKYVPGQGPVGATIMLVGQSASYKDLETGKPFSGPVGKEIRELLRSAGYNMDSCWQTYVCKYYVPPAEKIPFLIRAKNADIDMVKCCDELQNEINQIQPNVIIALGKIPLWALTGKNSIEDYRGSILMGMGRKIIPTYDPEGLLRGKGLNVEFKGYWARQIIIFDMKRAVKQSSFPEINRPIRNLMVCRNSYQLANFIEHHKNEKRLSLDIEALDCIPTCLGISFNRNSALSVPLWNTRGISNIPDADLASIWILLGNLLNDASYLKVGQNFKYDQDKLNRLGLKIDKLHSDTMLKAFTINPELPKSLAFNTSVYTEEPYYKNEGAEFNPNKQSIDDLYIYNARDAAVTLEIDEEMDADLDELGLRNFYHNFIMELHSLYLNIETHGFRIDGEKRDEVLRKYIEWDERISYELFKLCGVEVNVNSPKQVTQLIYHTFNIRGEGGTSEEVITQMLNTESRVKNPDHRKVLELILDGRRVKKTIGTYMMAVPDFDQRMKTTYYLCLETGRTSTGMQEPPIRPEITIYDHNGKKKKKCLGIAFQTITKHGDIGPDVRRQYIADADDELLVQADSSQAEARVVALLANDFDMLRLYDEHDIHALTASWFFGGTEDDYSKKKLGYESPYRFAGKTLRHAGNLGASKRRAAIEVNTQARKYRINYKITEAKAEAALNIFHFKSPSIRKVFHAGVIEQLSKDRTLIAPVPFGINSACGGKRTFFERWGEELFRQAFAYIPQRSVSDNTKAAALRIRKRIPGIKILVEAHDALLFSIKRDKLQEYGRIIKEEMERPIDFSNCSLPRRSLYIPCELEVSYDYYDFKKFKLENVDGTTNEGRTDNTSQVA